MAIHVPVIREGCPDLAVQLKQTPDVVIESLGLAMHQVGHDRGHVEPRNSMRRQCTILETNSMFCGPKHVDAQNMFG